jgi:hypothetical protein
LLSISVTTYPPATSRTMSFSGDRGQLSYHTHRRRPNGRQSVPLKPLSPQIIDPILAFRAKVLWIKHYGRELAVAGHNADHHVIIDHRTSTEVAYDSLVCKISSVRLIFSEFVVTSLISLTYSIAEARTISERLLK